LRVGFILRQGSRIETIAVVLKHRRREGEAFVDFCHYFETVPIFSSRDVSYYSMVHLQNFGELVSEFTL
jgi:hypothetical protein